MRKIKNILVVDDDLTHRRFISDALGAIRDAEVTALHDGWEAITSFLGEKKVDLLIMDVLLPGIAGVDALEYLKNQGIDAPVLIVTSITDRKVHEKCLELGAKGVLVKPLDENLLVITVEEILEINETGETS